MLRYARQAVSLPPRVAARKAGELISFRVRRLCLHLLDRLRPDPMLESVFRRALEHGSDAAALLASPESVLPLSPPDADLDIERRWSDVKRLMRHEFDLLGSGPVRIDYVLRARGVEGHRYHAAPGAAAAEVQRRRMERLIPDSTIDYEPIDWHVDFKSGYRWAPDVWSLRLGYGDTPGADVKVPWELSRFQHLGLLGLAYNSGDDRSRRRIAGEVRSQIVDWIVANPVRRGVNWRSPMDIALRAIGWLSGLALIADAPEFSPRFRNLVARSLRAHAEHIAAHLEYSPRQSGNHYLSNVVGLLCIAAALPELRASSGWARWALQQLVSEMRRQVRPGGSDFEGSTGYHCLVLELFLLGTCVGIRLPRGRRECIAAASEARIPHPTAPRLEADDELQPDRPQLFPDWYLERLLRMAEHLHRITKPDGTIPLIGDYDSGQAYRLAPPPVRDGDEWDRSGQGRDRRTSLAVAGRLFGRPELSAAASPFAPDARLLVGRPPAAVSRAAGSKDPVPPCWGSDSRRMWFSAEAGLAVVDFGPLRLVVSFALVAEGNGGGHYHNDLLSFELGWGGEDIVVDPGSYLYSPAPAMRNGFRSTHAHSTLQFANLEQRMWPERGGLFAVSRDARVAILDHGTSHLAFECRYGGAVHRRGFEWTETMLRVEDEVSGGGAAAIGYNLAPGATVRCLGTVGDVVVALAERGGVRMEVRFEGVRSAMPRPGYCSPAYGLRLPNVRLNAELVTDRCVTELRLGRASAKVGER